MKTVDEWRQHWLSTPHGLTELIHDVQNDAIAHARQESAAEIERLKFELDRLRKLAPLCDSCGSGSGCRSGCPYCEIKSMTAAFSTIDNKAWDDDGTSISRYDVDCDHARVARETCALIAELRAQQQEDRDEIKRLRESCEENASLLNVAYDDLSSAKREIKELDDDLKIVMDNRKMWATKAEDLESELATLRAQQPPAPAPQEPAESPIDKAAREACARFCGYTISPYEWASGMWQHAREGWRRVVAPFVKDEPPEPVKSDGELLRDAIYEEPCDPLKTFHVRVAALFLAKRAERDAKTQPTTERR